MGEKSKKGKESEEREKEVTYMHSTTCIHIQQCSGTKAVKDRTLSSRITTLNNADLLVHAYYLSLCTLCESRVRVGVWDAQ